MFRKTSLITLVAAAGLVVSATAQAAFIAGVTIEASTPSVNGRGPENTINSAGLTGLQHDADEGNMWQTTQGGVTAFVTYDLGAELSVDSIQIWNYNISGSNHKKPKAVDIEFSTDNVTFSGLQEFDLDLPTGSTSYEGVVYELTGDPTARYVRLTVERREEWANEKGLSEVRFTEVPEPAALSVLGLGGLALLRRRRMA